MRLAETIASAAVVIAPGKNRVCRNIITLLVLQVYDFLAYFNFTIINLMLLNKDTVRKT